MQSDAFGPRALGPLLCLLWAFWGDWIDLSSATELGHGAPGPNELLCESPRNHRLMLSSAGLALAPPAPSGPMDWSSSLSRRPTDPPQTPRPLTPDPCSRGSWWSLGDVDLLSGLWGTWTCSLVSSGFLESFVPLEK
ncbi:hypothetical protein EYF80_038821 [Liparis tanakae]|uniref:Uncharacterized protein n=1 Tax=Liparis tanakae TaxID=230148 RepID=A0A4Z2GBH5_9TELE|nr:hypothetical protein EYF80_038821 [Liparis tanakae]